MSGPKEYVHMTVDDFMKEHEAATNLGFKIGADTVLKMAKMVMPSKLYETMEAAVHAAEAYKEGQKEDKASAEWSEKKQKGFGYER